MTGFRPTCTRCWTLRPAGSTYCSECGVTLLPKLPVVRRGPVPVTRLAETGGGRYVVREVEGFTINMPLRGERNRKAVAGCEVVVLDTLWNHRLVYQTRSEDSFGNHEQRRQRARDRARARCGELNRAHEEAVAA